jgi:hypothetical protein
MRVTSSPPSPARSPVAPHRLPRPVAVGGQTPIPENVEKKTIPVKLNRNIDILFVVDNSGSMIEEQASWRHNFPAFINVLNTIEGGLPDVHIGVISTNVGTGGVNIGGCSSATRPTATTATC